MLKRYDSKNDTVHLYFAYGSNLFTPQMLVRCPESEPLSTGKVKNFRLAYSRKTGKGTGALDILPDSGRVVHGAIYKLTSADLAKLDKCEGLGYAYQRVPMLIDLPNGRQTSAWVYRVISPLDYDCPPNLDYANKVLLGMREWNLPYWYRTAFDLWSKGLIYANGDY